MQVKLFKFSLIILFVFTFSTLQSQVKSDLKFLKSQLDSIRTSLKIPGMAVAIQEGDSILFEEGFGYADLRNHIKVTPNTTFRIASITKTFTSTIIMQLVEQGKLNLEAPISEYGLDFGNAQITVRNLLTHTSEGKPGEHYQYNGYRFAQLGTIIEKTSKVPFFQLVMENIVQPLGMSSTAPGISLFAYFNYIQQRKEMVTFFETTFTHLAKPYDINKKGEIIESEYFDEFGTSGGLTTNVLDLLKYSDAIDRNEFVNAQTQNLIFSPNHTKDGEITPYGLGWFVQNYRGVDFYWHFGQTQGESGLFVKVPAKKLTLVILTNTNRLSTPFPLGDGDLFSSPIGQLFYKLFINDNKSLAIVDYNFPISEIRKTLIKLDTSTFREFYNKEIIAQATMNIIKGDTIKAKKLYELYADINFTKPDLLSKESIIVDLSHVGINQDLTKIFAISSPTRIRVYGVGENCSNDFTTWCDYGWIEDSGGKIVWQMQGQQAKHAGGADKNQLVDAIITLPAGSFKLRYKSDWAHAFNSWDSAPPDNFIWGITLFKN